MANGNPPTPFIPYHSNGHSLPSPKNLQYKIRLLLRGPNSSIQSYFNFVHKTTYDEILLEGTFLKYIHDYCRYLN